MWIIFLFVKINYSIFYCYPQEYFGKYWNKSIGPKIDYIHKYNKNVNVKIGTHWFYSKKKFSYIIINDEKYPLPNISIFNQNLCVEATNRFFTSFRMTGSVGIDNYIFIFTTNIFPHNIYEEIEMEVGVDLGFDIIFSFINVYLHQYIIFSSPKMIKYWTIGIGMTK